MASTLDGGRSPDRIVDKGHGTSALGPSDTSDTGSDITGGPGVFEGDVIGLDRGTNEDVDRRTAGTAGADIGDGNLDSDSDSVGTGEHKTAGREPRSVRDIGTDRVESVFPEPATDEGPNDTDGTAGSGRGGGP